MQACRSSEWRVPVAPGARCSFTCNGRERRVDSRSVHEYCGLRTRHISSFALTSGYPVGVLLQASRIFTSPHLLEKARRYEAYLRRHEGVRTSLKRISQRLVYFELRWSGLSLKTLRRPCDR